MDNPRSRRAELDPIDDIPGSDATLFEFGGLALRLAELLYNIGTKILIELHKLKLRFANTPADQNSDVDGPDNITVSPFGGVILAEDGDGANHLVGSTDRGEAFFFARNDLNDSEFTGPNFSDDRKILFANIQTPGHVFAIRGPFRHQR